MRSRVVPGKSSTTATLSPIILLKKVDLPTFGRPTIATSGFIIAPLPFLPIKAAPVQGALCKEYVIVAIIAYGSSPSQSLFQPSQVYDGTDRTSTVVSALPEAICLPFGDHTTAYTQSLWTL